MQQAGADRTHAPVSRTPVHGEIVDINLKVLWEKLWGYADDLAHTSPS
jgi:hypothetical protein